MAQKHFKEHVPNVRLLAEKKKLHLLDLFTRKETDIHSSRMLPDPVTMFVDQAVGRVADGICKFGRNSGIEILPNEQFQMRAGVFRVAFPVYEIAIAAGEERSAVSRINPKPGLIPELRETVDTLIDATMPFGPVISNPFDLGQACMSATLKIQFGTGNVPNPELCIVDFEPVDPLRAVENAFLANLPTDAYCRRPEVRVKNANDLLEKTGLPIEVSLRHEEIRVETTSMVGKITYTHRAVCGFEAKMITSDQK